MRASTTATFFAFLALSSTAHSQAFLFVPAHQNQEQQDRQGQPPTVQDEEKKAKPAEPKETSLYGTGLLGVGMEHRLYYKTQLLTMPEVLEELGLSENQREKLKAAQAEQKKEFARIAQITQKANAIKNDPVAKQAFRQQSLSYVSSLTREDEKPLLKVLTPEQRKRLEQLQLQADSYCVFQLPDFLEQFDFLDIQLEEFKKLQSQARVVVATAYSTKDQTVARYGTFSDEEKSKLSKSETFNQSIKSIHIKVREAREASLRQFLNVMDSNQRQKYKILLGKPFTFPSTFAPISIKPVGS